MQVIIGFLYDILWKIHTSLDLLMSVGKRKLIAAVYNKMKERAANQLIQVSAWTTGREAVFLR